MKVCTRCFKEKGLGAFYPDPSKRCGLSSRCKICVAAADRERRKANPAIALQYNNKWRRGNKEKVRANARAYYDKNKERMRLLQRQWAKANPDIVLEIRKKSATKHHHKVVARSAKYRAKKRQATPPWVDHGEIDKIYFLCAVRTFETGVDHAVDHIVPLKGEFVCGLHVPWNLQILTRAENSRKFNHFDLEGNGMLDEEFVRQLMIFDAQADDGRPGMWALLKQPGNMRRLIMLAARGVGITAKPSKIQTKTRIPDTYPDEEAKQKAIIYWEKKRRPDLVARVEEEAEKFHAHHLAAGTRSESWPASFRTWYSNALEFNKPPREGGLFAVAPIFEQTNVVGWESRLAQFYGKPSAWLTKWGGKPPPLPTDPIPADCKCPKQAFTLYISNRQRRA